VNTCWNIVHPPVATTPPILKHFISLANRETERGRDENRNHSISTRGVDLRGQEEGTNVEATSGRDASSSCNPPGIVIFLVIYCNNQSRQVQRLTQFCLSRAWSRCRVSTVSSSEKPLPYWLRSTTIIRDEHFSHITDIMLYIFKFTYFINWSPSLSIFVTKRKDNNAARNFS